MQNDIQEWHYRLQGLISEPSDLVEIRNGHPWARNRPLSCPVCGVVFYAYQRQDKPSEPYQQPGNTMRQTCGHPKCHFAEVERHQDMLGAYSKACKNYTESPKLEKKKQGMEPIKGML